MLYREYCDIINYREESAYKSYTNFINYINDCFNCYKEFPCFNCENYINAYKNKIKNDKLFFVHDSYSFEMIFDENPELCYLKKRYLWKTYL